jgi:hypothetical protein
VGTVVIEDQKIVLARWHANVAHLRDMMQTPGWDTYIEFTDRVIAESVETLLTIDPPGPATDWRKGYIAGLKRAVQIPAEVMKNTKEAGRN